MIPTMEWHESGVRMLDQRKLPLCVEWFTCRGYKDVIKAIRKMVIRGAPAIGVAAAMGMAMAAGRIRTRSHDEFMKHLRAIAREMVLARPTAVNLQWAVERMLRVAESAPGRTVAEQRTVLREEAQKILEEDIQINQRIGEHGQELLPEACTVLTHCNAGSLATAGYGTALGVIRAAHQKGKRVEVIADETRPWLQGLRLTAFELMEEGIPVSVIVDSAAGSLMRRGRIDLVITGADRVASNGDVANKIGTYPLAVLARTHGIPFYVAAPLSTIDPALKTGEEIPVEERAPEEILKMGRREMGPPGVRAINPAFDITPGEYVTALITEKGLAGPPYREGIRRLRESRSG